MGKGIIQVYTGDGKGKTTAAVGQGIRACGRNMKVIMIQFLKGRESGELILIERDIKNFKTYRFNLSKKFAGDMNSSELKILAEETLNGLNLASEIIKADGCDMLILDEIIGAINRGLISHDQLMDILTSKPDSMEIILTGRDAHKRLIDTADLVTEMCNIKHPYDHGITARKGIER